MLTNDTQPLAKKKSSSQISVQKLHYIDQATTYIQQPYRFVNLILYLIAAVVNALPNQTFTAINSQIEQIYSFPKLLIGLNGLIFPIVHPLFAFFANWILDEFGLKIGYLVGGSFLILGSWLRLFINQSIYITLIGSFIAAIGTIFIINSPSKFANSWFRPTVAPTIISIGVLISLLASSVSLILPTFFVNKDRIEKVNVEQMLIVQAIIITVGMGVLMILFKGKPKVPPSFSAAVKIKQNYSTQLKVLFSNKNYLLLLITSAASYGCLIAIISDIQFILEPFYSDNSSQLASLILVLACVLGLVGCILFTIILKRTQRYKNILYGLLITSIVLMFALPFILETKKQWILYIIIGLLGFVIIPLTPINLQFGCELVFPIGQASSSGYLLAAGQLLGFASGFGFLSYLDKKDPFKVRIVLFTFGAFLALGLLSLFFIEQDLRKINFQIKQMRKSHHNSQSKQIALLD